MSKKSVKFFFKKSVKKIFKNICQKNFQKNLSKNLSKNWNLEKRKHPTESSFLPATVIQRQAISDQKQKQIIGLISYEICTMMAWHLHQISTKIMGAFLSSSTNFLKCLKPASTFLVEWFVAPCDSKGSKRPV